jgi:putative Holliday junction resolvase
VRHNPDEEFLGVDIGHKRVGIARGSAAARLAEPLKTVAADTAIAEINSLAAANSAAAIIIGLPRNLRGEDTPQTQSVRQWVEKAKPQIGLPFYWQDEALTSVGSDGDDARAAAMILQDFLDTPAGQRVRC